MLNCEFYCNPLYPFFLELTEKYRQSRCCVGTMKDYVDINPKTDCSILTDETKVSFVPMPNVQEKNNLVSYDLVPYANVKKGFTVFSKGDLIWAKITPCMQNGKSCITDDMPTEIGFGSTEFHVIRKKKNDEVYMPFIWAIFSNEDVLRAAQATFSGSAGQQRVPASFLERFPAVIPDFETQVEMVNNLERRLALKNKEIKHSDELLATQSQYLLDKLSLDFSETTQSLAYGITTKQLSGRIDADFYSPCFLHFREQIDKSKHKAVSIGELCEKITSGFAAGKQDQADDLNDDERVSQLRPFSITPYGQISFATKKYVPISRLQEKDYCKKGEVLFNNTNSAEWVGKSAVFDIDTPCATSNHITRITLKEGLNPYYIAAFFNMLRSIGYWKLLSTYFNNQAGVNTETLKTVRILLPEKSIQDEIAEEILRRKNTAEALRIEAEQDWEAAKAEFERKLLGK